MTTARDLVYDAAALIGEYAVDKNLSDTNAQLMLRRMQRMIDSWANAHRFAFAAVGRTFTMVAGTRSYSSALLSGGGVRPTSVVSATVTLDNIDYIVNLIDIHEWNSIGYKQTTAIPAVLYVEATMPDATFNFWPTPYAPFVATLYVRGPVTGILTLASTIVLPEGYEQAIVENLAVKSAPLFGTKADDDLKNDARNSYAAVKRNNYVPGVMQTGLGEGRDIRNPTPYKDW